jgi:hypothetical protein
MCLLLAHGFKRAAASGCSTSIAAANHCMFLQRLSCRLQQFLPGRLSKPTMQLNRFLRAPLTCKLRHPRSCSSCISAPVAVGRPPTSCAASDTFKDAPSMSTRCSHRSRSVRDGLSLPLNSSLVQHRDGGHTQQERYGLCPTAAQQQQAVLVQAQLSLIQQIAGFANKIFICTALLRAGSMPRYVLRSPGCLM